jgi:hypothetical protein
VPALSDGFFDEPWNVLVKCMSFGLFKSISIISNADFPLLLRGVNLLLTFMFVWFYVILPNPDNFPVGSID